VIPAEWLLAATTVSADQPHLAPRVATSFFGYGYQTWIVPSVRRRFALLGVRGQSIYVDPTSRLVMVHTAVRRQPSDDPGNIEAGSLWLGLLRTFGR
jgi:CubicO group peptidase (beta-lactamase class C family)